MTRIHAVVAGNSKVRLEKTRVLEVNFCIPGNGSTNSCHISICCSRYHSLFKKFKLSSKGQVLAKNELSESDAGSAGLL